MLRYQYFPEEVCESMLQSSGFEEFEIQTTLSDISKRRTTGPKRPHGSSSRPDIRTR